MSEKHDSDQKPEIVPDFWEDFVNAAFDDKDREIRASVKSNLDKIDSLTSAIYNEEVGDQRSAMEDLAQTQVAHRKALEELMEYEQTMGYRTRPPEAD